MNNNNMYVCVCNAVTESDIRKAVKDGANCMNHLQTKLGVSTKCGTCACEATSCLERALDKELKTTSALLSL